MNTAPSAYSRQQHPSVMGGPPRGVEFGILRDLDDTCFEWHLVTGDVVGSPLGYTTMEGALAALAPRSTGPDRPAIGIFEKDDRFLGVAVLAEGCDTTPQGLIHELAGFVEPLDWASRTHERPSRPYVDNSFDADALAGFELVGIVDGFERSPTTGRVTRTPFYVSG